jgi:hypothetical protein
VPIERETGRGNGAPRPVLLVLKGRLEGVRVRTLGSGPVVSWAILEAIVYREFPCTCRGGLQTFPLEVCGPDCKADVGRRLLELIRENAI